MRRELQTIAGGVGLIAAALSLLVGVGALFLPPFYWAALVLAVLAVAGTALGRSLFASSPRTLAVVLMLEVAQVAFGLAGVMGSGTFVLPAQIVSWVLAVGALVVLWWPKRWPPSRRRPAHLKRGGHR